MDNGEGSHPSAAAPRDGSGQAAAAAAPRLARSESRSPLLPCGLTEEELAAITLGSGDLSVEDEKERGVASALAGAERSQPASCRATSQQGALGNLSSSSNGSLTASSCSLAGSATPETPHTAQKPPDGDRRCSFEKVNRVAAAVAAEKQRRRRLERQLRLQDARPRSQGQLARWQHQQPSTSPRRQAPSAEQLVLLARQRSASEGQLEALVGPSTPRGSAEAVTAAQRLAAIAPDSSFPRPAPLGRSWLGQKAAPYMQPPQQILAAAGTDSGFPRPVHSSAPPLGWKDQLTLQPPMPAVLPDGSGSPASPFGQRRSHAADLKLQPLPDGLSYPTLEGDPCSGPGFFNHTAAAAANSVNASTISSQRACLPRDQAGKGKVAPPHAVILRLTSESNKGRQPTGSAEQDEEAGTGSRRKGLLAALTRLLPFSS